MSVTISNALITSRRVESRRTSSVSINIGDNPDPRIVFNRTIQRTDDGVIVTSYPAGTVRRKFSQVASQSMTIGGKTLTVAELYAFISGFADQWDMEDMAKDGSPASPGT
jgi:hypothetical protein